MPLIDVLHAPDDLLDLFHTLKESVLAHCCEPEPGLFIAESAKVSDRACKAGYDPVAMLVDETQMDAETDDLIRAVGDIPVYTAPAGRFKEIAGYPMTRGCLTAFRRRNMPALSETLAAASSDHRCRIAVLENVVNPVNTGSIFRNAAALGIDAVLLSKGCCDPLARRALRVSMGTVFQIPWTLTGLTGSQIAGDLKKAGFRTAAMALSESSVPITDQSLLKEDKLALFLGNEGNGLTPEAIASCDDTIRIPMRDGVDSLNVAAASAVAFWALTQPPVI